MGIRGRIRGRIISSPKVPSPGGGCSGKPLMSKACLGHAHCVQKRLLISPSAVPWSDRRARNSLDDIHGAGAGHSAEKMPRWTVGEEAGKQVGRYDGRPRHIACLGPIVDHISQQSRICGRSSGCFDPADADRELTS